MAEPGRPMPEWELRMLKAWDELQASIVILEVLNPAMADVMMRRITRGLEYMAKGYEMYVDVRNDGSR